MSGYHAYKVRDDKLSEFLAEVAKNDDMGGNAVEMVKSHGEHHTLVVISRQFSYPYITDKLKEMAEQNQ